MVDGFDLLRGLAESQKLPCKRAVLDREDHDGIHGRQAPLIGTGGAVRHSDTR